MNNKEFTSVLTSRTKYNSREVTSLVRAAVSAITAELTEENSVIIPGFGTFEAKKRPERVLVNPTTKQHMLVPPKMTVSFKPNIALKTRVKN